MPVTGPGLFSIAATKVMYLHYESNTHKFWGQYMNLVMQETDQTGRCAPVERSLAVNW